MGVVARDKGLSGPLQLVSYADPYKIFFHLKFSAGFGTSVAQNKINLHGTEDRSD